ncbi:MAG: GNAT family N-acetyltransferase [Caulobacterales bacterium]
MTNPLPPAQPAPPPMPPTPVLETARLILRPVRESDVDAVQRGFGQWEVVRWLHAGIPWPYPPDGAATNMVDTLKHMAGGGKSIWAITLKDGPDELIGRIDLWPGDGKTRDNRGFWLAPEYKGRGLMTEAAERVTEYAFMDLGWPHLWLTNAEANVASGRIKEKQGARLIERVPGQYVSGPGVRLVWLLTREDWVANHLSQREREGPVA